MSSYELRSNQNNQKRDNEAVRELNEIGELFKKIKIYKSAIGRIKSDIFLR